MAELYKFYKNDCAPCYALSRNLIVLENEIPEDINIIEKNVGIEENKILAKSFGLDGVPALVFPNGNKLIGSKNTKEQILNFIITGGNTIENKSIRK
jgi:thiol-disulfide isomerase/thioredoxin